MWPSNFSVDFLILRMDEPGCKRGSRRSAAEASNRALNKHNRRFSEWIGGIGGIGGSAPL